jgi:hypothetical protein
MIRFEEMTLGEIEEIELMTGKSIEDVLSEGQPKGRALRVLYYILKRRDDAKFKFEDTEKLSQKEAVAFLTGNDPKVS